MAPTLKWVVLIAVCVVQLSATSLTPEEVYHDSLGRIVHVIGGGVSQFTKQHDSNGNPRLGPDACDLSCQDGYYGGGSYVAGDHDAGSHHVGSHEAGDHDHGSRDGPKRNHHQRTLSACGKECNYDDGDQLKYSKHSDELINKPGDLCKTCNTKEQQNDLNASESNKFIFQVDNVSKRMGYSPMGHVNYKYIISPSNLNLVSDDTMNFRMGRFDITLSGVKSNEGKAKDYNMLSFTNHNILNDNLYDHSSKKIGDPNMRKSVYKDISDTDETYSYNKPSNFDHQVYNSLYEDNISTEFGVDEYVVPTNRPNTINFSKNNRNYSYKKNLPQQKNLRLLNNRIFESNNTLLSIILHDTGLVLDIRNDPTNSNTFQNGGGIKTVINGGISLPYHIQRKPLKNTSLKTNIKGHFPGFKPASDILHNSNQIKSRPNRVSINQDIDAQDLSVSEARLVRSPIFFRRSRPQRRPKGRRPRPSYGPPPKKPSKGYGPPPKAPSKGYGPPQKAPSKGYGPPPKAPSKGYGPPQKAPSKGYGPPQKAPSKGYGPPPKAPAPSYGAPPKAPAPSYKAPSKAPAPSYKAPSKAPSPSYGPPPKAPAPTYGAPPKAPAPSYGAPPKAPAPSYGAPPKAPAPSYGAPPKAPAPTYGAPPKAPAPSYGAPPKAPAPTYGAPPKAPAPSYGAPPKAPAPSYGAPPKAPAPSYGAPPKAPAPTYGAPSKAPAPTYGAPPKAPAPSYGAPPKAPAPSYGAPPKAPAPSYGAPPKAPAPSYGPPPKAPAPSYGPPPKAPAPSYGPPPKAPAPSYGPPPKAPAPSYGPPPKAPAPSYGPPPKAPEPSYGAPPKAPSSGYGAPRHARSSPHQIQFDLDDTWSWSSSKGPYHQIWHAV